MPSSGSIHTAQLLRAILNERKANTYQKQLVGCEEKLQSGGWFFGWF